MILQEKELIIATDSGVMQVYDTQNKTFTKTVILSNVKDFMGDLLPAKIYAVDRIDNRYLILSNSGKSGYVNMWIDENNITTQVISPEDKILSIKARFIDKEHILLGLLSNEAILFDIKNKKVVYRVQLSQSKFSDFSLNDTRDKAVFSCESGVLSVIDTNSGKLITDLQGLNVDNVYKVDFKKDTISGAGQDRRGSLYTLSSTKGYYIEGSFLIYATALSPSTKRVAFAMDEQNNIEIFDTQSKSKIAKLQGQKSTLNSIIFEGENRLFSSSDDSTIMVWNIK